MYPLKTTPMPARIVVVHDDPEFIDRTVTALLAAGYDVTAFTDTISALAALEAAQWLELLITRVIFPPGQPNGVALARMARVKKPGVKVLFASSPRNPGAYSWTRRVPSGPGEPRGYRHAGRQDARLISTLAFCLAGRVRRSDRSENGGTLCWLGATRSSRTVRTNFTMATGLARNRSRIPRAHRCNFTGQRAAMKTTASRGSGPASREGSVTPRASRSRGSSTGSAS